MLNTEISKCIKGETWIAWAKEVTELFIGETSEVYYSPWSKESCASGLFHNRLLTYRRHMKDPSLEKRSYKSKSNQTRGGNIGATLERPRNVEQACQNEFYSVTDTEDLSWLRTFVSPEKMVTEKWRATFKARIQILKSFSDRGYIASYLESFPALKLQSGFNLVSKLLNLSIQNWVEGNTTE